MSPLWRPLVSPTAGRILAFSGVISVATWALHTVPAKAQETVYVGGSGQPSVEVNLDVLDNLDAYADGRLLLHPGEKPLYVRRSAPQRIYGRDIIRIPAPASGTPLRAAIAAPQPVPTTATAVAPALAPPAQRPLVAAKPPAPVEAPPLSRLPEKSTNPVKRAASVPPVPLPERTTPPVTPRRVTSEKAQPLPASGDQKRLTELAALRDEGLITADDYAAKRSQIINPPSAEDKRRLADLSTLRDEALISEADYAAKRADIMGTTPPTPPAPATPPPPAVETAALAPATPPSTAIPSKPATRVAALPKRPPPSGGTQQLRLDFAVDAAGLSPAQIDQLKELAGQLESNENRVQIRSYAGAEGDDTGNARRVSLKRALAIRSRLIEYNIRSTRIDVRALGIADQGPANRVDILTVAR